VRLVITPPLSSYKSNEIAVESVFLPLEYRVSLSLATAMSSITAGTNAHSIPSSADGASQVAQSQKVDG